ncbi:MAG: 2-amino-4-hydroxy-6-hydroxymethyldihydropteridine diphosphokinase [Candidatus Rokubacteria bacterium]|nr:2-amino-4-hydroxy-6-hydroxymethyldihydropteridine diphosphokinase [Candidatus Rokubacteria bacterium]
MARVFLSLGSNLGDRLEQLRRAIELLTQLPDVRFLNASPLYETEPWDYPSGEVLDRAHWFFNCVVEIETSLPPEGLLAELQAIEGRLGRVRSGTAAPRAHVEPRTMDIDILLYGDEVISVPDDLHIPHLFLHERRFVLRPLADLAPHLEHPVLYRTIHELLDGLEDDHRVIASDLPHQWFLR